MSEAEQLRVQESFNELFLGRRYGLRAAAKDDVAEFIGEAGRCSLHVFLCYLTMTHIPHVPADPVIGLGTGVTVAGSRLLGDDTKYFTRVRMHVHSRRR